MLYFNMVTAPPRMVGLERMSDYRGLTVHSTSCIYVRTQSSIGEI